MPMRQLLTGSSSSIIKLHNVRAILLALLRHEYVSRVRLAKITGLSTTTITNLVTDLLEQGVVTEDGHGPNNGRRGVGRPQTALRIIPEARSAVGIHFDVDHVNIAITDLYAHPQYTLSIPHPPDKLPNIMLTEVAALVKEAVAASSIEPRAIIGAGVGASGLVDTETGVNVIAPNLGWRDVPVRQWLAHALNMPVYVENNVRAMALGEMLFGAGRDTYTLAFVYSRVGVGAGLVVGGEIYRGSGAGAGEIGHTTVIPHGGETCRCGNSGCLETLVSESAIAREAFKLAEQNTRGLLAQTLRDGEGTLIERIFSAARAGDTAVCAMLEERAQYMGIALANLVNVLNPEMIVLGGVFAQGEDLLFPTVEATLQTRAFANLGERVVLRRPSFDGQAGMIGAAALALNHFFYHQNAI